MRTPTPTPSQSRSSGSETEQEEGQLNDIEELPLDMEQFGSSDEDISNELVQQQKIDQIDHEMQQRIVELHDKMEANGLHGAVDLIEKLFDKKPGTMKQIRGKRGK